MSWQAGAEVEQTQRKLVGRGMGNPGCQVPSEALRVGLSGGCRGHCGFYSGHQAVSTDQILWVGPAMCMEIQALRETRCS